jgi:hypothetical protein
MQCQALSSNPTTAKRRKKKKNFKFYFLEVEEGLLEKRKIGAGERDKRGSY